MGGALAEAVSVEAHSGGERVDILVLVDRSARSRCEGLITHCTYVPQLCTREHAATEKAMNRSIISIVAFSCQ